MTSIPKVCKIKNCTRHISKHSAKGLCAAHYKRLLSGKRLEGDILERSNRGKSQEPEYKILIGMRQRCYNINHSEYHNYGGRGINICDRWSGVDGYKNFLIDMGRRPSSVHSIDRIDVNGDYDPSNCRWADVRTQNRNRRVSSSSGHKGVYFDRGKYKVEITLNYKNIYIGRFERLDDAVKARKEAESIYWS